MKTGKGKERKWRNNKG